MKNGRQWQKTKYHGEGGAFLKIKLSVQMEQWIYQHEKAKSQVLPALSV